MKNSALINDIVKIANQLDIEGEVELADELTVLASSLSGNTREAQFGGLFRNPIQAIGGALGIGGGRGAQPQQPQQQGGGFMKNLYTKQFNPQNIEELIRQASYAAAMRNDTALQQQVQNLVNLQQQYRQAVQAVKSSLNTPKAQSAPGQPVATPQAAPQAQPAAPAPAPVPPAA